MARSTDGRIYSLVGGEPDRGYDIRWADAASDHRGSAVNHLVPDFAGGLVPGGSGRKDFSAKVRLQRFHIHDKLRAAK
jgi:hypothetical protein